MTSDQLFHMEGLLRAVDQVAREAIEYVRRDVAQRFVYLTRVLPVNSMAYTGLEETLKLILESSGRSRKEVHSHWHDLGVLVTEVRAMKPAFGSILEEAYRWHSEMVDDYHPDATPLHRGRTLDEFLREVKERRLHEAFRYWIREEEFREKVQGEFVDPRLFIELWMALVRAAESENRGQSIESEWRHCKVTPFDQSLGPLHYPAALPREVKAGICAAQTRYRRSKSEYLRTGEIDDFTEMVRCGHVFQEVVTAADA